MTEQEMLRLRKVSSRAHHVWDELQQAKETREAIMKMASMEGAVWIAPHQSDVGIDLLAEDYRDGLKAMLDSAVARLERQFAELKV